MAKGKAANVFSIFYWANIIELHCIYNFKRNQKKIGER